MVVRSSFWPMGGSGKKQPFVPDFVVLNTRTAGDYPFRVKVGGVFDTVLVGPGGGGYGDYFSAPAGSSGAAFEGEVYLPKGDYIVRVGQASHGNGTATILLKDGVPLITAGGGASRAGAAGTLAISSDCQVVLSRIASNGRQGGKWSAGASVSTTGWGRGGPAVSSYGGGTSSGEAGGTIVTYKRLKP
ncbi:MAG: hypothetical protein OSJ76_01015 [Alphaproteobacteria bacterium]|nr:hypothetical protein [Alphaproteobacteria bacterium]